MASAMSAISLSSAVFVVSGITTLTGAISDSGSGCSGSSALLSLSGNSESMFRTISADGENSCSDSVEFSKSDVYSSSSYSSSSSSSFVYKS